MKAYTKILNCDKYASIRWIANVIFTGCGKPSQRLTSLMKLVDAGREIGVIDFTMPYQGIRVDGVAVCTLPLLDRGELIQYGDDWYKHN
jgi:hypothetical protein